MNDTRLTDAAYVLSEIAAGRTFYICTAARITKIVQKNVAAFAKAGYSLLETRGGSLYMRAGKKLVSCSGASLRLV
jgi:hypothetical protein